jgi:hypothetical protein
VAQKRWLGRSPLYHKSADTLILGTGEACAPGCDAKVEAQIIFVYLPPQMKSRDTHTLPKHYGQRPDRTVRADRRQSMIMASMVPKPSQTDRILKFSRQLICPGKAYTKKEVLNMLREGTVSRPDPTGETRDAVLTLFSQDDRMVVGGAAQKSPCQHTILPEGGAWSDGRIRVQTKGGQMQPHDLTVAFPSFPVHSRCRRVVRRRSSRRRPTRATRRSGRARRSRS